MRFKKLALCLAIVMLLAVLVGCHEDVETASEGTVSDFESQTHIPVNIPDDASDEVSDDVSSDTSLEASAAVSNAVSENDASGEASIAPLTGEIVVSEKKYDYKGNNIELLHVENQTNLHLNVTVHGTYFDADKKVIKKESQTITAFPSGQSTYVIFYPFKPFDSFTYTIDTERYVPESLYADENGTPYASYLTLSFKRDLRWDRWPLFSGQDARILLFTGDGTNTHPTKTLCSSFHMLVLDENGEVYATDYDLADPSSIEPISTPFSSGYPKPPMGVEDKYGKHVYIRKREIGEEESIPDTLQESFTVIYAVMHVYDLDESMRRGWEEAEKQGYVRQ